MTPSLEEFCSKGHGGTSRIEYVYLQDVDPDSLFTIVAQDWNRPYDVILLEGEWQTLPTLPTPRWQENENKSNQGSSYTHLLTAQTRQLSAGASGVFDAISRRRILLRITDANGQKWVVGNQEQAFNLSFQRSSGGNGSFAGYNVSISGETSHSVTAWNPFL